VIPARPACAVIVRKIRPRGTNARVRRIENTSITVQGTVARTSYERSFSDAKQDVLLLVVRPVRLQCFLCDG